MCLQASSRAESHVAVFGRRVSPVVSDRVDHFTGVVVEGQAPAVVAELDTGAVEGDCEDASGVRTSPGCT
jgi:hypothetical protein